jgi:hypothetical protein
MISNFNRMQIRKGVTEASRASARGWPRLVGRQWIMAFMLLATFSASAQEALQNSLAGEAAAGARTQQMQSTDYTFKDGDFQMLVLPSMGFEWNDNINLSKTNTLDDYILKPAVGITASYPLSQRNLLYLDINVGYDRYLLHHDLSTFDLNSASGTGLSFDIGIKDVTLNLHDWMSYVQDSAQNATVANTASYGTFQNTAGIAATWDLNQVTLSAGYDHQNVIATSSAFDEINHASEMFFARAAFLVHPKVTLGVEASAAFTTYEQTILNNNDAYTAGTYVEFRPSTALTITARGGYSIYQFQNTSTTNVTSDQNSWYASVNIAHQPRESISYALEAGRETQLGTTSDLVQDWYVRPNVTWKVINGLDINTSFFYEHGNEGVGSQNVPGNSNGNDTYDWYGGELTAQHPLSSRFTLGLDYRLTFRSSSSPDDGYTQNLVGLQLTYHPK